MLPNHEKLCFSWIIKFVKNLTVNPKNKNLPQIIIIRVFLKQLLCQPIHLYY